MTRAKASLPKLCRMFLSVFIAATLRAPVPPAAPGWASPSARPWLKKPEAPSPSPASKAKAQPLPSVCPWPAGFQLTPPAHSRKAPSRKEPSQHRGQRELRTAAIQHNFMRIWHNSQSGESEPITHHRAESSMHSQRNLLRVAQALSAAALFCSLLAAARPAAAQGPYHVIDHWKLADSGWWDYLIVDSPAHRLYITRGDHVDVLDTQTGKLLNTIGHLHGTHGVALDTAGKFGYISDGGGNAVVAFDRNTLGVVATT